MNDDTVKKLGCVSMCFEPRGYREPTGTAFGGVEDLQVNLTYPPKVRRRKPRLARSATANKPTLYIRFIKTMKIRATIDTNKALLF